MSAEAAADSTPSVDPAASTPVVAGPSATPSDDALAGDRTLKGHTFSFPVLFPQTAFITTHFGVRQGAVLLTYPRVPIAGHSFNLSETGLTQNFDFGVKITDWIGLYGVGSGTVVTGTNMPSIVAVGGAFNVAGEVGPVARIYRNERTGTQVAARLSGGLGMGRNVSVLALTQAVLASPQGLNVSGILQQNIGQYALIPTSSMTAATSVELAQAFTKNFSLQGAVEGRHTADTSSPYDPTAQGNVDHVTQSNTLLTTVALAADGAPSGIPLGLVGEYLLTASTSSSSDASQSNVSHFVGAGLYYTGRRHLQVGVGGAAQLGLSPVQGTDANGKPAASGTPSTFFGQFILRYIW